MKPLRHLTVFALAGCWFVLLSIPVSGAVIPLNSFEDPAAIKQIQGSATRSQSADHVTDGTSSLRVDFPNRDYPNVVFPAAQVFAPADWSNAGALLFDAFNAESMPMAIVMRFRDASGKSSDTSVTLPAGRQQRVAVVLHLPNKVHMKGYPLKQICDANQCALCELDATAKSIASIEFFLSRPGRAQTAYFDHFRLADLKPITKIVDQYGQSTLSEWPGKIHRDQDLIAAHSEEAAALKAQIAALKASTDRDAHGGWAHGPQLKATGWFRTQKLNGKWWLVTPSGHLFWSVGIDCVGANCASSPGGAGNMNLFSWLPAANDPLSAYSWWWGADFYQMNLYRTYGKDWETSWRSLTGERITAWGFNTLGAWSGDKVCAELGKPFTVDLSDGNADKISGGLSDFFSNTWSAAAEANIRKGTQAWSRNPLFLGYFVGNEMEWTGAGRLPVEALLLPGTRAIKAAFTTILKSKYATIEKLNASWGMAAPSWTGWSDFQAKPVVLPAKHSAGLEKDLSLLLSAYANQHYSTVNTLVKKYAPNQLYLGSRFSAVPPDEVAIAAGNHCDVVTYNIYGKSEVLLSRGKQIVKFDKPAMVGEFHFGALDRGMFGGGMVPVETQLERGLQYANYVNTALAQPWCVGVHWFQYIDQPILGRGDGENFNIGFVSVGDVPYPELVNQAKAVHANIYKIRNEP